MTTREGSPVHIHKWGEFTQETAIRDAVRVFIEGQHAGSVGWEDGAWHASHPQTRNPWRSAETVHDTADDALKTVLRSGWARRLGARASSPVTFTDKARRIIEKTRKR